MFSHLKLGAFAFLGALALSVGVVAAGETAPVTPPSIDQQLQATADELTKELADATSQIHQAEQLGQPSSVANQYGSAGDIDAKIGKTVDQGNAELDQAQRQIWQTENLGATPIQASTGK